MDMDDKELFSSATADDPISEVADQPAEAPATETPQQDGRPRDEHGRFAPKGAQAEPEPQPEPEAAAEQQLARDDGGIPAWRLREMREERNAERQRAFELQRQLETLQRQMPKPEPAPRPDLYENPDGFIGHHLQEYVDPRIQQLEQRIAAQDERYRLQNEDVSRERAIEKYGREKVQAAVNWLGQTMQTDPDAERFYKSSIYNPNAVDPFKTLMTTYQQYEISSDPDGWALRRAAELNGQAQAQPPQQSASQERAGRPQPGQPQGSNIKLPTSLRSVPSARSNAEDDDNDMSDAALFRHATR